MARFVPAIHVFLLAHEKKDVDAQHKARHDELMGTVYYCNHG